MKILHIGEKVYGGGAENVFYHTISSLGQRTLSDMEHYFAFKSHEKIELLPDLDFNFGPPKRLHWLFSIYSFRNYWTLKRYLKKLNPDIVHLQLIGNLTPSILSAVYAYKTKNRNVGVIQTVHSFEHICSHQAAYDYRNERRCTDCLMDHYKTRIFYRFCSRGGGIHSFAKGIVSLISDYYFNRGLIDFHITPSQFLASLLISRYGRDDNVRVVKNPISGIRHEQGPRMDIITYFGRLSEEKNLQLLFKSIPYVLKEKNIKVKIIGEGPDKGKLVDLANRLHISEVIDFVPFVPHSELSGQIANAKVYVLTSKLYETFSLVLYESIMAGLLPVVPAHGAIKDGVDWLKCGLLYESENHKDLADKIINAIDEYQTYLPRLKGAQEKIGIELTSKKYIDNLIEIYRTVGNSNKQLLCS